MSETANNTDTELEDAWWEQPDYESTEAAEERRQELVAEVQSIQAQLGSHGIDPDTNTYRMSLAEHEAWKRKAKLALRHKITDLQKVNAYLRQQRRSGLSKRPSEEMTAGEIVESIGALVEELARRASKANSL